MANGNTRILQSSDFGRYEKRIYAYFERLFGTKWQEPAERPELEVVRQALHRYTRRARSNLESRAIDLVRRAYELRSEIVKLVNTPGFPADAWQYLVRLTDDMLVRDCFLEVDGSLTLVTPTEIPHDISEPDDPVRARRLMVARIAAHFPNLRSALPKASGGSGAKGGSQGNVLVQGVTAALLLGGYFDDKTTKRTSYDAEHFRQLGRLVKLDFSTLTKSKEFGFVSLDSLEQPLVKNSDGSVARGSFGPNGPVAIVPGLTAGVPRKIVLRRP